MVTRNPRTARAIARRFAGWLWWHLKPTEE
jgi:hypothetical protein